MPTEGPLMPPAKAARRQPDQTELEDLRASAALWGLGVSRTYSLCVLRFCRMVAVGDQNDAAEH